MLSTHVHTANRDSGFHRIDALFSLVLMMGHTANSVGLWLMGYPWLGVVFFLSLGVFLMPLTVASFLR